MIRTLSSYRRPGIKHMHKDKDNDNDSSCPTGNSADDAYLECCHVGRLQTMQMIDSEFIDWLRTWGDFICDSRRPRVYTLPVATFKNYFEIREIFYGTKDECMYAPSLNWSNRLKSHNRNLSISRRSYLIYTSNQNLIKIPIKPIIPSSWRSRKTVDTISRLRNPFRSLFAADTWPDNKMGLDELVFTQIVFFYI